MDAISIAQLTVRKEKEAHELAEEERMVRINSGRDKGRSNCRPGALATQFSSPAFRAGRGGGTRSPGVVSGGGGGATGGSSSSSKKVKPMDEDFTAEMEEVSGSPPITWDQADMMAFSQANERDMEMCFEEGWTGNELSWDVAHALMTYAMHTFAGSFPRGKATWDEDVDGPWHEVEFPGMTPETLETLCSHFGANASDLRTQTSGSAFKLYTGGWRGEQLPPCTVKFLNETLAEMLLDGENYEKVADFPENEVDGGENSGLHKRMRMSKSKSGRKTRESKNGPRELGLNG